MNMRIFQLNSSGCPSLNNKNEQKIIEPALKEKITPFTFSPKTSSALKSRLLVSMIAFKGAMNHETNRIVINDLLNNYNELATSTDKNSFDTPKYNSVNSGLSLTSYKVKRENQGSKERISILSPTENNKLIAYIDYDRNRPKPLIDMELGNFPLTLKVREPETKLTLIITGNSCVSGNNFTVKTGEKIKSSGISFKGNSSKLYVSEAFRPDETEKAVKEYFDKGLYNNVEKGDYAGQLANDYSILGLAGGYGSRFAPILEENGNNKPSTFLPGKNYRLLHISILDMAIRSGLIDSEKLKNILANSEETFFNPVSAKTISNSGDSNLIYIKAPNKNSLGTGGGIISALQKGIIPSNKPAIILTGDNLTNIDLSRALKEFENSNSGFMMIGFPIAERRLQDFAPIGIKKDINGKWLVEKFYDKRKAPEAKITEGEYKGDYVTSTNICIIHPKVLQILKNMSPAGSEYDFMNFFPYILKTLNKEDRIANDDGKPLKMTLCIAEAKGGKKPRWNDIGTIPSFFKEVRKAAENKHGIYKGLPQQLLSDFKNLVDSETGVICMSQDAKSALEKFKQKHSITDINGDVIAIISNSPARAAGINSISAFEQTKLYKDFKAKGADTNRIYDFIKNTNSGQMEIKEFLSCVTSNDDLSFKFIKEITQDPRQSRKVLKTLISKLGEENYLDWYLGEKGYMHAYDKYTQRFFNKAGSIEELLKFSPNWGFWKLEEKALALKNPDFSKLSSEKREEKIGKIFSEDREINFTIGKLPEGFSNRAAFVELTKQLKAIGGIDKERKINADGYSFYVQSLKGGDFNDKHVFSVKTGSKKYIIKADRVNLEDLNKVEDSFNPGKLRLLSNYEKRAIRKSKLINPDSIYFNACLDFYLNENNCKNVPKMHFYDFESNSAVYEYIEDKHGDPYQCGLDCENILNVIKFNKDLSDVNSLGVYCNDTSDKNILTTTNGNKKIIDLGHASYLDGLKPGCKTFHLDFTNINGVSLPVVLASKLLAKSEILGS